MVVIAKFGGNKVAGFSLQLLLTDGIVTCH